MAWRKTVQSAYSTPPPCQITTRSIDIKVNSTCRHKRPRWHIEETTHTLLHRWLLPTGHMDTHIHRWISNRFNTRCNTRWRSRQYNLFTKWRDTLESATATGKHCTNYAAEVKALSQRAQAILDIVDNHEDIVFLT